MSDDDHSDEIDIERRSVLAATAGSVTAGAFGLSNVGSVAAAEHDAEETVTIIHDTHFHGRFEDSNVPSKDIVAYDDVIRQWREEDDNTIFLGNGDELAPSVLGLEFTGAHMIEALNLLEPDAVGPGNHEFDFGVETATDRFEESEFPWVVANLLDPDGNALPGTERWMSTDVGGITVGVFGLVVNSFYSLTDFPEEYEVIDNIEAAREATEALQNDGADLIICPAHVSSGRMETIAESVDGLDAIIGSHSGVVDDEPQVVNGTLVSEFGDEYNHLARLEVDAESGDLLNWERADFYDPSETEEGDLSDNENHTPVDVTTRGANEELQTLVEGYQSELDERLGQTIVESDVELNATFDNYAIETGMGNLILDIMRDVGNLDDEIDVATQNAGGIRSNATYGPGEITGRDINNILPFPNEIEVYELEGEHLYEYLENQVRPMPGDFGAQPAIQVSGISYEWRGHDGEEEINNVLVGGEPIEMDETYLVSTNDYEAGRTVISEEGELVLQSGQFQGAFVMNYLDENYDTIAPEREHRMIRVDEYLDTVDLSAEEGELAVTVENTDASESALEAPFRLLAPSGETVSATAVEEDEDSITATFDAAAVVELIDEEAPEPQVRLLGGFEPDDEYYGYEEEGETVEVPVSSGYDYHKLQAEPDAESVLNLLQDDDEDAGDDSEGDDSSGDDDSSGGDDSNEEGSGDETEQSDDDSSDDAADDSGPGFGPFAALTGTGGAAYFLSQRFGDEETSDEE